MIYLKSPFSFGLAVDPADKEQIYRLRVENYQIDAPYLLQYADGVPKGKDGFDDGSHLFYAKNGESVVASCRLTPFGRDGWEIDGGVPASLLPQRPARFAQFSRTLVDRAFRNRNIHAPMFYFVSEWVMRHTRLRYYFSVCTVPLYRFYAAYGAVKKTEHPFSIQGRKPHRYYFIEGKFSLTNTLLKQQLIKKDSLPVPQTAADLPEIKDHGEDTISCRGMS